VIGWDSKFRVCEWNPAAESIFGYSAREASGRHASFIVPRHLWEKVDGVMAALLANRGGSRSTNENITKAGATLVCEWFNTPLVDPEGRVIGVASLVMDVTARARVEAERARLTTELERKNQDLESILYFASHDLRSPLVNLQGFGTRLEKACAELFARQLAPAASAPLTAPTEDPLLAERVAKALRYIRASVDRMDTLISGLLQVARLGRVIVNPRTVDINALLAGLLRSMTIQIETAQAEVQWTSLPSCHGDPQLLAQVFANLLDNALKYRDPARPLRITVAGWGEAAEVVYVVADTGAGIAPAHQPKIWEMFHRLHPEGPVAGDGLGLKIVRRIVDRHHGRIWVESTPGVGTRFHMSLPNGPERLALS
jgi:PAS domain S-box-containing protein